MFKWRTEEFSWVDFTIDVLRILIVLAVVVGSWNTLSSGRISFAQWLNLFVAGLSQGSIYALIALGYTLVYGILLMINFAHGEVFMAGAFSTVFLAEALNRIGFLNTQPLLSIMLMILFAGLISMTVAILLERIAYRPLRGSPRLVPLITAIGASFFLQYTFRGLYGSGFKAYPQVQALQGALRIGANQNSDGADLRICLGADLDAGIVLAGRAHARWQSHACRLGKQGSRAPNGYRH